MAYWRTGNLTGFDGSLVELTGRIVGKRPGELRFHDGIGYRWIPRQYIHGYRRLGDGYCILTLPSWLAKQRRFVQSVVTHVSTRQRRHRLVVRARKRASKEQHEAQ